MLKLAEPTASDWAQRAAEHIDEILLDHAHCEKKAAGAAVQLLFRYPQHAFLQVPLSRLAREELAHFERVLGVLQARGKGLTRQRPSPYGGRLHAFVRRREPEQLLDLLLVSALIEARSCERFRELAAALDEPELAALYRELLASEARHHQVYVELAEALTSSEQVRVRLAELAQEEAAILREPAPYPRLHT
jgi:tRNA-(ms[2]io[6]A)-hydroxylase